MDDEKGRLRAPFAMEVGSIGSRTDERAKWTSIHAEFVGSSTLPLGRSVIVKHLGLPFFLAAFEAFAQPAPTTFPADSTPLSSTALQEALAGKVYAVKLADGTRWRWQFNSDGFFYLNVGSFSDSGKWTTKDSALCSEGRQITASCNEVRRLGTDLLLKRDNGSVVTMSPQ